MPERSFTLRTEEPRDVGAIAEVTAAAFKSQVEADLVDRIRAFEGYVPELAIVADLDGEIIGHSMMSWCQLIAADGGRSPILQLSPVSVRPDHQGVGVGSALCRELLARATARGDDFTCVLGHPGYYPRFGFDQWETHGIAPPVPEMGPAFMVARLDPDAPARHGTVEFSAPFDGT